MRVRICGFAVGEEDELGDFFGFGEGDGGEDLAGGLVVAPFGGDEEVGGGGEDVLGADLEAVAQRAEGEALGGSEGRVEPPRRQGAKGV